MSFKSSRTGARVLAVTIGLTSLAGLGAAGSAHAAEPGSLCIVDTSTLVVEAGSVLAQNQVGSAGCVTISVNARGGAKIALVEVQQGWTHSVKSAGGTSDGSRIQVDFTNKATRAKASLRWDSGRVTIK